MNWENNELTSVEVLSKKGQTCRINAGGKVRVTLDGKRVRTKAMEDGSVVFDTQAGQSYTLVRN